MQILITLVPRLVAGVSALLLGQFCVSGAYEAGMSFSGQSAALAFAAMVVGCWFAPVIIRTTTLGTKILGWFVFLVGTMLVLATSLGNIAKHRSENVGSAQHTITAYDDAVIALKRLDTELKTMLADPKQPGKPHPRWTVTAGCSNDTVSESMTYCQNVRRVQDDIRQARATIDRGRPISADPQAASLRKFIDATPDQINEWMPILLALGLEIGATGLMSLAFAPIKAPAPQQGAPEPPQEAPEPAEPPLAPWMASAPLEGCPWPRYTPRTVFGWIDGRKLRWMPKNPKLNDNQEAA
jgi:hypothetical protein